MQDIAEIPWNGFNVVSTFSGAGGSCLGYRLAGYRVLWANEFIPAAQEVYKANHTRSILDTRDIREVQPKEILKAIKLKKGELDLFDGSPPCSAFSMAGNREKDWGKEKKYSDTKQRVDDLFFEYTRILKGLQPKVFIAENVKGLTIGKSKGLLGDKRIGFFKTEGTTILDSLRDCGYAVSYQVLNAKYFGVPQSRSRIFIIGVRNDLGILPVFPIEKNGTGKVTLREAFSGLSNSKKDLIEADIKPYAIYPELIKLGYGDSSNKYFSLVKANPGSYSPTYTQAAGHLSAASVCHWDNRRFTIPEVKRLCAFPDDFILNDNYKQSTERMGRSVPPLFTAALAKTIQTQILEKLDD
jgi:DNA (cytosine-5)-methyltransferase 1